MSQQQQTPPEINYRSDRDEVYRLINWLRKQVGTFSAAASFWTSTSEPALTGSVDIGSLTTGILKVTVAAGYATPSIAFVNTDFPSPDAYYVVTRATNAPPNAVNLGAQATGVLQQTVAAGIATIASTPLTSGRVLWGGPTGLIAQEDSFYWDTASKSIWLAQYLGGAQQVELRTFGATNQTSLFIRCDGTEADLVLRSGTFGDGPEIRLKGQQQGGNEGSWVGYERVAGVGFNWTSVVTSDPNLGLFKFELQSLFERTGNLVYLSGATDLDTFSWRGVTHKVDGPGGSGGDSTNVDGVNFHSFAVNTLQSTNGWSALYSATVKIEGPTTFTPVDGSTGTMGAVYGLWIGSVGHIDRTDGTWEWRTGSTSAVSPSGAGRIRYNESLNQMEFSQNGSAYAPFGTGSGTVTAVSATLPLTSTGGATPDIALNYDGVSLDLSGGTTLRRAALTGDITAPAGSNTLTLATVNASPGTYTYATVTVNGKGLVTVASSGATPVPATRTLAATSPILIDGGAGPLDLSANRTFSHATSGVAAGSYTFASITVNASGHLTAASSGSTAGFQPTITWPAADQVLYSSGTSTDPIGSQYIKIDTATNQLRIIGTNGNQAWYNLLSGIDSERVIAYWTGDVWTLEQQATGSGTIRGMQITSALGLNAGPDSIGTGYMLTVQATATRDRAWWAVGGVTVSDGVNREWFTVSPGSTTVNTNNISLLATVRVRATDYTLTGVSASLVASVYADQPTFNGGNVSNVGTSCWVYYAGGGTTSQSKFEGAIVSNSIATGLGQFAGDGSNVFDLPTDNTGNTSAAIGRVPVNIAGITKYLRYYND